MGIKGVWHMAQLEPTNPAFGSDQQTSRPNTLFVLCKSMCIRAKAYICLNVAGFPLDAALSALSYLLYVLDLLWGKYQRPFSVTHNVFSASFHRCFSRSDHLALHMKRHIWGWKGEEWKTAGGGGVAGQRNGQRSYQPLKRKNILSGCFTDPSEKREKEDLRSS